MFSKKIVNIVFYKVPNGTEFTKQATLFLEDGTIKTVSFEEGIDACEEIAKERHIKTKDAFREMINHNIIHVTTTEDFKKKFQSFIPVVEPVEKDNNAESESTEVRSKNDENNTIYSFSSLKNRDFLSDNQNSEEDEDHEIEDVEENYEDEDEEDYENDEEEGFFKRAWKKIKKSHAIKATIAVITAAALAVGLYSCAKRQTREGVMKDSNLTSISTDANLDDMSSINFDNGAITKDPFYKDPTIKKLLKKTNDKTQKTTMMNTGNAMDGFNNIFAYLHREDGVNVQPALKFDEVIALQVAYNDYSRDQLVSIFNGADIRSGDMSRAYKDANLQLMGAYAMEDPEHPVNMSMLIDSQEGKDFYKKYHDAFLAIKTASDEDKAKYATEFYKMVRQDFPVTKEVRTEGISHAENYDTITPYKLSVAPMIAAAEMMWQNLKTDVTLANMEVDFINDLGLCNYADKTFERAELLSLSNPTNEKNPTFQEYRDAYIAFYKSHGIYYIDDEHRELTKLQAFQDAVNWHFKQEEGKGSTQVNNSGSKTTTRTKTYSKKSTKTFSKTTRTEKPITAEAKKKVDQQLEAENKSARQKAEAKAEKERQRLQAEADKNAAKVEEEVRKDAKDLTDRIKEANQKINQNQTVNQNDLGHGVQFDASHSDGNGNLDSSVGNITIDPKGDETNKPLPDPNETGRRFDARANSSSNTRTSTNTNTSTSTNNKTQWVESKPVADDYYYENAWVEYEDDSDYSAAVNSYVEGISNGSSESTAGRQYVKQ